MAVKDVISHSIAVAGQGFLRWGGVNAWVWGENLSFSKIYAKNCIKMKEIGPGASAPGTPLDPPMYCKICCLFNMCWYRNILLLQMYYWKFISFARRTVLNFRKSNEQFALFQHMHSAPVLKLKMTTSTSNFCVMIAANTNRRILSLELKWISNPRGNNLRFLLSY